MIFRSDVKGGLGPNNKTETKRKNPENMGKQREITGELGLIIVRYIDRFLLGSRTTHFYLK